MKEYHEINSVFKRDQKGKFTDEFARPEFEYLYDNEWIWTEKIDGTNIRIGVRDGKLKIGGKTDNAQIPVFLYERLQELFSVEKFNAFESSEEVTLYGEGHGKKIQKVGSLYNPTGVDFILFNVNISGYWLDRENIADIAEKLEIDYVPMAIKGTIGEAIRFLEAEPFSKFGDQLVMEDIVGIPIVSLFNKLGNRVITKLKVKDFK
jgi:hypothetical protein